MFIYDEILLAIDRIGIIDMDQSLYDDEIVLLVLSSLQDNEVIISEAVQLAYEDGLLLVVFFIIDDHITSGLIETLSDQGYVGEKTGKIISESILRDYQERAQNIVKSISEEARDKKIETQTMIVHGDYHQELERALSRWSVAHLLLKKQPKSFWQKILRKNSEESLDFQVDPHCSIHWIDDPQ